MKGNRFDNVKDFMLALCLGIIAARCISFERPSDAFIIGYLVAHIAWVLLVAYGEIQRKRRYSRQNHKRMASL